MEATRIQSVLCCNVKIYNWRIILGKTTTAIQLAKKYSAALLTIDGVVLDAISNGSTPAGIRARDLCADTARRKAEELKAVEADEADKKLSGGLSMEAVQAHTAGQAPVAGVHSTTQSMVSNRKTSSMAGAGKDKHPKLPPGAQHTAGAAMADASSNSQVCSGTFNRQCSVFYY